MIGVRTYWFPGEFYEANPGSSTRYIEAKQLHVEAITPPYVPTNSRAGGQYCPMRLVEERLELPAGLVADAREELLASGGPANEAGFRWGYLLGVDAGRRAELPLASRLDELLRDRLVEPGFSLSFLKAAEGPPPEVDAGVHYDGFHLDTHPELTDDSGPELARILVNLAPFPRSFRFAKTDRFELARRGLPVHRGDYQVVELPDDVETELIEIPPYENGTLWSLRFWASVVPHVGLEGPEGHFLASYERVSAR
jgi:hypothetical protein